MSIVYRNGYKYQLCQDYSLFTSIYPPTDIKTEYISLTKDSIITIKEGYAWDGPSGPTFDTKNFMRGSLVHDALYQLMRENYLDHKNYRDQADKLLEVICQQDGMSSFRSRYVHLGVRLFGEPDSDPSDNKPPIEAP